MAGSDQRIEVLLWSIALPGFGQLLNGKLFKSILFIGLEFLVNAQARINDVIYFSFIGDAAQAWDKTNLQWLMFYPCVYMFACWDAYRDAGGNSPLAFLPFVMGAYFGTLGIIFSGILRIDSFFAGPMWLPLGAMIAGAAAGILIKRRWGGRMETRL
ncbi:MAG TPA: hypothetical protein PKA10_09455 [Selenomonadales bacterium]|nr:hypothetical protein [Selenomonadales bacterium]